MASLKNVPATATSRPCKRRCTGSSKHLHDVPAAPVPTLPQSQLRGDLPSGAIYKREEDGIVLIDQDKCRGWRLCISGCPYKKNLLQLEKRQVKNVSSVIRELSQANQRCSETCVGRIRYLGVLLYDADRIEEAASTEREFTSTERQCEASLDPHDPSVIEEALKQGIPENVIDAAQRSPVYKMAMDWKLALTVAP